MKIIVSIKQVPDTSGKVAVNPDGTLNRASMQTITNPDDMNALEAALKIKDATGCKVTVVTMGPPPAAGMLREALAMGADEAYLVSAREFGGSDTYATSQILAAAINKIGVEKDDEYGEILAAYCRCPLAELIVHPRLRVDAYRGTPRWEPYGRTLEEAPFAVAYNGDIFDVDDFKRLTSAYPQTRHVMLGRGVLGNPALPRVLSGGAPLMADELRRFHDALFAAYEEEMGGNAVMRMKEWWLYASCAFADEKSVRRRVRSARKVGEYRVAVESIFSGEKFLPSARYRG